MPSISASGSKKILIKSPNGRTFYNTLSAIQFLIKNGKREEDRDVKLMSLNLKKEGWSKEPFLPKGWMMSGNKSLNNCKYLTDKLKYFGTTKAAVHFLKKNGYSDTSITSLETRQFVNEPKKSVIKEKKKDTRKILKPIRQLSIIQEEHSLCKPGVWENGGDSLPHGWKKTNYGKGPGKGEHVMSPEGVKYKSRFVAFQQMLKMNFPPTEVAIMKLKMREYERWELSDYLPEGWMYKVHWEGFTKDDKYTENIIYLSRDGQSFHSMKQATDFILTSEEYSSQDAYNCQLFLKERLKMTMGSRFSWKESDSVPPGWKVRDGGDDNGYVMSPEGLQYKTRYVAIQAMAANNFPLPDILLMRSKLIEYENWNTSDLLPEGWIFKSWDASENSSTKTYFLSENGISFESMKEVINHMKCNPEMFNQENIENCKAFLKHRNQQNLGDRFEWESSDNLPAGWKIRYSGGKSSQLWIRSPRTGQQYRSRFCAIQEMIKNKDLYTEEEVDKMRNLMIRHESWVQDERLPSNWLYKITWEGQHKSKQIQSNIIFLSSEGDYFGSFKTATEHMKKFNHYSEFNQENLRKLQIEMHNNLTMSRDDWIEDNETLPNGWMKRFSNTCEYFLRPDGRQFKSRLCAYQAMIRDEFPEEQITSMRTKLAHEGWLPHDLLPENWFYKKASVLYNNKVSTDYQVLSSNGDHFMSLRAASKFMSQNSFSINEITNFDNFIKDDRKNNVLEKNTWFEDDSLPEGWRYRPSHGAEDRVFYLSACGQQFRSALTAVQFMYEQEHDRAAIVLMRLKLANEGWSFSPDIPSGWQQKAFKTTLQYLDRSGVLFKNAKHALTEIQSSHEYSEAEVELLRARAKSEEVGLDDKYTWRSPDNLPRGWKVRRKLSRSRKMIEFFLAPDGKMVRGKAAALAHMATLGASPGDVVTMRSFRWFRVKSHEEKQEEVKEEDNMLMEEVEQEIKDDNLIAAGNSEIIIKNIDDDDDECTVSSTTEDDSMDTSTDGNEIGTIDEVKSDEDDKEMLLDKLEEIAAQVQLFKKIDKTKLMNIQNFIRGFGK